MTFEAMSFEVLAVVASCLPLTRCSIDNGGVGWPELHSF